MEEVVVIADPKGKGYCFAKGVYNYLKSKEGKDFSARLVDFTRTDFKDGEFKVRINENIRRKSCYFIHDSNKNPADWYVELNFVLEALNFSSPKEIVVVIPYMRFARQDRKDESRVSVNSKAVAKMITEYSSRGMTVDLHAPQVQEYFDIPFDNLFSFPSLVNYLKAKHPELMKDLVLVSPDLGGGKRVEYLKKKLDERGIKSEVALGYKSREKANEVKKVLIIGEVEGKNCLVVDDIIDTGNTLIKTAEVLKKAGAKSVYAYGTHGIFTEGYEKMKVFDKILVSDTLCCAEGDNIEVVSLVNLFGEAIYRTAVGESLSDLFDNGHHVPNLKAFVEK